MFKVLDKNKNVICVFGKYTELCIESSLEFSDQLLTFRAAYDDIRDIFELEGFIETENDRYVIKEIEKDTSGKADVYAKLDLDGLEGKGIPSFETVGQTIDTALSFALAGTGWTIGNCEITKRRTLRLTHCSALDVIIQALKTYRCEVEIDSKNKVLNIRERIGQDRGAYLTTDLNLRKLTAKESSYDFYTEIEPYGKDGMTIESVNDGSKYLTDYSYSDKRKRLIWKDERYTIPENLMEDAQAKLSDMAKPYVSYSADIIDLAKLGGTTVFDFCLGDIITIISPETGTREQRRIVGLKVYPDAPEENTCTIANKTMSFDEMVQKYEAASETVDNITTDNGTVRGESVNHISTSQILNFDDAVGSTMAVLELTAELLTVTGNLTAVEAEIGTLTANVGTFEQLTADNFDAVNAAITQLRTEDLTAANARINTLESTYANVSSLLNGNAGIGNLQNIHLTSQNAIIDSALIQTMLADNAIVRQLMAGKIYTDDVEITSEDGSISIKDGTQTFKDSLGNVRLQLGQDALGDFTFVLYDETGSGILIDSTGIKESAIGNGLIKDSMVASNAGIQASKLDIASLFQEINGSALSIKSNRIWIDEAGQSMNQVYSQIQTNTTQIVQNTAATAEASSKAQAAQAAAEQALSAISGISTLTGYVVTLSNDAHVVHTYNDGTGGDYTEAFTIVKAYLGDTDVSDHTTFTAIPSPSVQGTWNANTKTYQVTGLTEDDGYVDFQCSYGHDHVYLTTRSGANLQTRNGNNLTLQSGSATITKRFSISKSPDGKVGTSYNLQCSTSILRKDTNGFVPAYVTFSALYNDGVDMRNYSGRYKIEESTDGTNFTQTYMSVGVESTKTYFPTSQDVTAIRCTLYDSTGTQRLDVQTVTTLIDAQGILEDFADIQEAVQHSEQMVTTYTQAVDQLAVQFQQLESTVAGYSDGRLLYQTPYTDNGDGTVTVHARVYKDGVDATTEFPARWFTWKIKTEAGTEAAPNGYWGYSTIVPKNLMGFGGVVIGRFATYDDSYLLTRSGLNLCTRSGNRLTTFKAA